MAVANDVSTTHLRGVPRLALGAGGSIATPDTRPLSDSSSAFSKVKDAASKQGLRRAFINEDRLRVGLTQLLLSGDGLLN